MRFNNQKLASGTGVLVEHDSKFYLITAWHNLSGKHPETGQCISKTVGIPNWVDIEAYCFKRSEPLFDRDNVPDDGFARFKTHPEGSFIDIAALELGAYVAGASQLDGCFLDPVRNDRAMRLFVSQLCHIIGFPEGLADRSYPNMPLALWKTGHIASEPESDFMGQPIVVVDARTRPGMSGSPVIVREFAIDGVTVVHNRLVGIYTGRFATNDKEDSGLGRVVKPHVINETLSAFRRLPS